MSNKEAYRQLAAEQDFPLFHQPWWLDMVCPGWDAAIAVEKGNKAVWPFCVDTKAGLILLRNPLLTPYLGPLFFYDDTLKPYKKLNAEDRLYEKLWAQMPKWDFFDVQCLPGYNNFLPFQHKGFSHTQRLTYEIGLHQEEAAILAAMNTSKRNYIRQAERELQITDDASALDNFYRMHLNTLERKGKKHVAGSEYFKAIINTSIAHNAGVMLTAKNDSGIIHASIFVVFSRQRMYYLLSAINPQQNQNGAVPFLIWTAIKKAKEMNLATFDFEGSVNKGIEPFFRDFGGRRVSFLSCANTPSRLWRLKQFILG